MRKQKSRGMLGRTGRLSVNHTRTFASPMVHAAVAGSGLALGYVAYPYRENPMGATLLGAAGSIMAVGLLLLIYDLVHDKRIVQA